MKTFVLVAKTSDVPVGSGTLVDAEGQLLALFNIDGKFYAIDDHCPHEGAPLSEGEVDGCQVVCPWHAARFDVTTGKLLCPPGTRDVETYPVKIEGDEVLVEVETF